MAHLQYMPGDPRLVDQLVCELKSKGIFDQFRKECIADVDTRPAYQNLRQRVETSVSTFLARQCWKPELNKNQLREKLRKHILDGNYLEQGVERIVDQVVNPKVATVFIPKVEDLVYNYLGIPRKKTEPETTNESKPVDLLPTDLEAVSPGSVKSNDDKNEVLEKEEKNTIEKMEVDKNEIEPEKQETKEEIKDVEMKEVIVKSDNTENEDKCVIPLPTEEIKLENIPPPDNSPPKAICAKVELDSIILPHEPNISTDIPLPEETPKDEKDSFFKTIHSEDSNSSSDSSLRRNMSPLTPIRNYNNENSCDAQQGFDTDSDNKSDVKTAPSTFRFTIETKEEKLTDNSNPNPEVKQEIKTESKEKTDLSYQFNKQVNINAFNTPMYDDSSNSNNLHIDYESDVNSKTNIELKPEVENSQDSSKKEKKNDDKKSSHKSSHRSRDSSRHSSSKDRRSDSKHSTSRDSSRHDKKSSARDDKSKPSKERERSKDRRDGKDSRDSSRHRSSHKSSSSRDNNKDSKSHRSTSSSYRHSSKNTDEKKSTSSSKDKEKNSESSRDKSKDKPRDSKSSSGRDKDRKSSSSSKKSDEKDKKKDKKDVDDHYSSSGRGNHSRRSTDRDSNDGSSSSKGSQNHTGSKASESKKDSKSTSSKSENTSTSESPSPSDKEHIIKDDLKFSQFKPAVRVDNHLETPIAPPPRLPFVPDVTLKKPKYAANLQEAKKMMKMRKFLDEEQKRMNQEAALLLEFQANVRPSLSQVYSSIPGPELEFACVSNVPVQDSNAYKFCSTQAVTDTEIEQNLAKMEGSTIEIPNEDTDNKTSTVSQTSEIIDENIDTGENIVVEEVMSDNTLIDNQDQEKEDKSDDQNSIQETEHIANTYDENKPFSQLMDEISEYSKASEIKNKTDVEEKPKSPQDSKTVSECKESNSETSITETTNTENGESKYFEVTVTAEAISESEEIDFEPSDEEQTAENIIENKTVDVTEKKDEAIPENDTSCKENVPNGLPTEMVMPANPNELQYFAEHEKYDAELERHAFSIFLKQYMESYSISNKIFTINCDTYEENIVKEVASSMGEYEVINYYKNGHLKLPSCTANVIKDVPLSSEVVLPTDAGNYQQQTMFSPIKSECSFDLDFDSKMEDIHKKSRQEVMEIILGSVVDSTPSQPDSGYSEYTGEKEVEESIEEKSEMDILNSTELEREGDSLKRRIEEVESSENNNRSVLTPKKMRTLSGSDQISSTTEECEESSNNNRAPRSKYLGPSRRVGLPRPKRTNVSSSPTSDQSVENYAQNTPRGKAPRLQRYDTTDLYKPKLHYLSRRHNVT